jgi:hypothetical protein
MKAAFASGAPIGCLSGQRRRVPWPSPEEERARRTSACASVKLTYASCPYRAGSGILMTLGLSRAAVSAIAPAV